MNQNPSIGEMRQIVSFLKNTPVSDGAGGFTDNYSTLLTCRGKLRPKGGSKKLENGEFVMDSGWTLECRFQSAVVIATDTIISVSGTLYRIQNVQLIDNLKHFYTFTLTSYA